jgi:cytochrome c553
MKQKNIILLISSLFMALNLSATEKKYSMDEIYNLMCIECHSSDGSGNTEKLTPSMVGQSEEEMLSSLIDVENDDGHIIMEHNRGEIIKKGMKYSAKDMAAYMYVRFNQ